MKDESPENIAENEAMKEMHVFCRSLKEEYGRPESCVQSLSPTMASRDFSLGGSSGALTSLLIAKV